MKKWLITLLVLFFAFPVVSAGITLDDISGRYNIGDDIKVGGYIQPNQDILIALRFRPVYADAQFAFSSGSGLPLQGSRIESVGTTQTGVTRKVVVDNTYTSAPTLFDAAVYSQSSFGY